MQNFNRLFLFLLCSVLVAGLLSCSSNTGSDGETNFDRSAMLQNYGENIIIPAYDKLQQSVTELNVSANTFANDPTPENLDQLQANLKDARLAWQDASIFQFGPAEMETFRASVNTYPANIDQVNSNIESGDYTLGTISNQDAAGLPTVGYLIHGVGESDQEIITKYTSDTKAENRTNYLLDNTSFIKQKTDAVVNAWKSSGDDYLSTFLSEENAGTDVGSSLGMLVNAMVLHYERFLRDGKIGIPSGVRSAGVARPQATEAYYAGYSLELAIANTQAMQRLFLGTDLDGNDGRGLEDNLEALDASDLSSEITNELDGALSSLQELNDPLSEQVENNNESVTTAFQELQQLVALLKADMSSILGITITFQDNDGD